MSIDLSRVLRPFLFIAIALVLLAPSYFRTFDNYELELLDIRFLLRGQRHTVDDVVLIEVGDDTIEKLGEWPLDRAYYAMMVKALSESGAKEIIFDIFFSEKTDHDPQLEEAIRNAGNVYLPFVFELAKSYGRMRAGEIVSARAVAVKTLESLKAAAKGVGHINIAPDIDGKYRRIPLFMQYGSARYPYLSLIALCDYLGIPLDDVRLVPGKHVVLGDRAQIPLDDTSSMIINFSGRWASSFTHYSFVDILQSYLSGATGQSPILDLKKFKGKVCVIGLTATGTVDLHPNPWETLYPGVGVHAEVFNGILKKTFISRVSREINAFALFLLSAAIVFITLRTRPLIGLAAALTALALLFVASVLLFDLLGLWIDLFYPIASFSVLYLSATFYKYIAERQRRQLLEKELSIAKTIQESFLPKSLPRTEGLQIAVRMFTARQVGGDLYDFLEFGEKHLGVMIGDVSGKGVPASLFMAKVISEFKFFAGAHARASAALADLNSKLVAESASNLFVTVFYLIFDMEKARLSFSNGGHLPAIVLKEGSREIELMNTDEGTPLGLIEGPFSEKSLALEKGETIVLYTDGVTEAMDKKHAMYGTERLCALVKKHRHLAPEKLLGIIHDDVKKFEGSAGQHDDITIMIIKVG